MIKATDVSPKRTDGVSDSHAAKEFFILLDSTHKFIFKLTDVFRQFFAHIPVKFLYVFITK